MKGKNTKKKIVSSAWKLFYEQGYEHTTVEDIVALSETSKGSFYHYFDGKDGLLGSLSFLFDDKYEEIMATIDPEMDSYEMLLYINVELFGLIENTISIDLLARLYSTQLVTKGERHLLDQSRTYYRVLRKIVTQGQEKGQLKRDISVNEIVKLYALCERGLMYDWCICNGNYSLRSYGKSTMPLFLQGIRA